MKQLARDAMAAAFNTTTHPADAVAVAMLREVVKKDDEMRVKGWIESVRLPLVLSDVRAMLAEFTPAPVDKPAPCICGEASVRPDECPAHAPVAPEPPREPRCECRHYECNHVGGECQIAGCECILFSSLPASEARPTTEDEAKTEVAQLRLAVIASNGQRRHVDALIAALRAESAPVERPEVALALHELNQRIDGALHGDDPALIDPALTALILAVQSSAEQPAREVMEVLDIDQRGSNSRPTTLENLAETVRNILDADKRVQSSAEGEIARLKAEWEKASDKYHAEADSQIEWQARAEAAELALRALQDAQAKP